MKQKAIHLFIMAADQLGAGLRTSGTRILRQALIVRLRHAFSTRLEAIAAAFSWLDEPDHESVGAKRLPLGNIVTEIASYRTNRYKASGACKRPGMPRGGMTVPLTPGRSHAPLAS